MSGDEVDVETEVRTELVTGTLIHRLGQELLSRNISLIKAGFPKPSSLKLNFQSRAVSNGISQQLE